jgi:DNA-binding MarR family transcriptional regulator
MLEQIDALMDILRRFRHMSHLYMEREFAKRELVMVSNPRILFRLKYRDGDSPVTQKQLADWLGVAPPTVAVSIKRMEKSGLVRKTANRDDLRENYIEITDYGLQLTDQYERVARHLYSHMFRDFEQEELEQLYGFFQRLIANMEKEPPIPDENLLEE